MEFVTTAYSNIYLFVLFKSQLKTHDVSGLFSLIVIASSMTFSIYRFVSFCKLLFCILVGALGTLSVDIYILKVLL